jgi:O-antigen/teichoic acid export membrane protein
MALIMVVVLPVSTSVFPEISRRFEKSKDEGIVFLKKVMLYAGLAAAAVSLITYFIAPLAIRIIFGSGFTPAINVLKWLAPIPFLVMTATLLTVQGLYGMGLQKWAPWVGFTLAVVCISMNLILIPRLGVAAVCISWVVAEILECLLSGLILLTQRHKVKE